LKSNISQAETKVQKGVVELKQASDEQKKARTKLCCIVFLIILVVGVAVVLIVLGIKVF